MADGTVLELLSLAERHLQLAFYRMYGFQTAIRLSLDPIRSSPDVARRTVSVDYLGTGTTEPVALTREISWAETYSQDDCERGLKTGAERDITEKAALVVMALLIHDIADIQIQDVMRLGTGPDYSAEVI